MPAQRIRCAYLAALISFSLAALPPKGAAQTQAPATITLDQAIQMALQHNHALQAARTTIQQSQAEEITANLRPNPVLLTDAMFIPFFQPSDLTSSFLDYSSEFDLGVSYLFERGKKRQHRLQAARDVTAQTRSLVADNERTLSYQTAAQFINVQLAESTLRLARQDLASFQNTVTISRMRYKAGDISEDDYLKIKLQLLQFQTDVSQAQVARAQGLSDLRQLLGYESVPANYDLTGTFQYQPVKLNLLDLEAQALKLRPDLRAARQGVTAANSAYQLQKADGKRDVTGQINYTHVSGAHTASMFATVQIPIFDRNQGEIARAHSAVTQAQQLEEAAQNQTLTDVRDAYEGLRSQDQILKLFETGYLQEAKEDRDISEYAYRRGAASLLDFLDAERSYRSTELAYRQAVASYLLALEQLREAVGTRSLP